MSRLVNNTDKQLTPSEITTKICRDGITEDSNTTEGQYDYDRLGQESSY